MVRIGRVGLVGMSPLLLTSSWCATWLALTEHGGIGVIGSLDMFLISFHAFRLLCVRSIEVIISSHLSLLLLSTHFHDPCLWGESDVPACGPPANFSVHLASSAVTPAGSVHKSMSENVVRVWEQL